MKKLIVGLGILALALGVGVGIKHSPVIKDAQANTVPYSQLPRIARYQEVGLNVAAGAAITSAVLNLDNVSECTVLADNSANAGGSRALNIDWIASDGTTILFRQAVTVALSTRELVVISPTASTASLPSGVVAIPSTTGKKMQFTLASGGANVGSLAIICQ